MKATWKRYQTDVNNEYPVLGVLETDFPQLVISARRELTKARLQTNQEQWKREANPDYLDSKAYQRAVRQLRRAQQRARSKLVELAEAAGLCREVFDIEGDVDQSSTDHTSVAACVKEALLRQVREWSGMADAPPPKHYLLTALKHCGDHLSEADSNLLGLASPSTIADAVACLLSLPGHVSYDLHGYWVEEAVEYADRRVKEAWDNGFGYVTLIHGSPEVTHWSGVRSLGKGGIKWSLRGRLFQGEWNEYVYPRQSKRHRIGEGSMTLAVYPRTSAVLVEAATPGETDLSVQA